MRTLTHPLIVLAASGGLFLTACMKAERLGTDTSSPSGGLLAVGLFNNAPSSGPTAHPQGLDAAFGTGGVAQIEAPPPTFFQNGVSALQPDGGILISGWGWNVEAQPLFRVLPSGQLDTGFGSSQSGRLDLPDIDTANPSLNSPMSRVWGEAVQSDGRIVIIGRDGNANLVVVRLNPNGSVDTSFGGGDGILKMSLGTSSIYGLAIALQSDGKIVVAGEIFSGEPLLLLRLLADGSLDFGFGTGGIAQSGLSGGGYAVAIQGDGKILVAGSVDNPNGNRSFSVMRFNANGTLDSSFGAKDGIASLASAGYDMANSLALLPDGRIVSAGVRGGACTIARFTSAGAVDTGYNNAGWLALPAPTCAAVVTRVDGHIIAGGTTGGDFFLAQTLADGTLDLSFGYSGTMRINISNTDELGGLLQQSDGAILATGHSNYSGPTGNFAVLRIWP